MVNEDTVDALYSDDVELLQGLISSDPRILSAKDQNGHTLLHLACLTGSLECIRYLLNDHVQEAGKTMFWTTDTDGLLPIDIAAQTGHTAALPLLRCDTELNDGIKIDILGGHLCSAMNTNTVMMPPHDQSSCDVWGRAACIAIEDAASGNFELLSKFMRSGLSFVENNEVNETVTGLAKHLLLKAIQHNQTDIALRLMEHPAVITCINAQGDNGNTPLHLAIGNGNMELIEKIADIPECDLSIQNSSGLTPMALAGIVLGDSEEYTPAPEPRQYSDALTAMANQAIDSGDEAVLQAFWAEYLQ